MMSEMCGRGVSGGGGRFNRSDLHLKKELTQIRKVARVLRDPGTTSSWRSPLSSARSTVANGDTIRRGGGDTGYKVSELYSQVPLRVESKGSKSREKKVYLYNWRRQRSSSKKSAATAKSEEMMGCEKPEEENDGSSSSVPEGSAEDSLSGARNGGDSKSDTYIADRYASMIFKCKGTNLKPSIRRATIKNKSKRSTYLGNSSRQQMIRSRISKQSLEGLPSIAVLGLSQDESLSLVNQSDDTKKTELQNAFSLYRKTQNKNAFSVDLKIQF